MIVTTGYGFLAILIPALLFGFAAAVLGRHSDPSFAYLFAGTSAALCLAWLGRKLNGKPARELIDAKTGERVLLKQRHTLFWIPMEWWAIPTFALGTAIAFALYMGDS